MSYPLHRAAAKGDIATVARLVETEGMPVDSINRQGNTVLYTASVNGQDEIVAYLMSKGANPNAQNLGGLTPLFAAAMNNQVSTVAYLLGHGADGTIKTHRGNTAADLAYGAGAKDVLPLLEAAGILIQPEVHKELSLWIGSPPFNPDPQIYLLAGGHGCEDVDFDTRETLPDGYKLVVMSTCGSLVMMDEIYKKLVRLFLKQKTADLNAVAKDNFDNIEERFEDLKSFLGADLRLYLPGDKYPNLHYTPFLNYENPRIAYISGIRKYPIDPSTLFEKKGFKHVPLSGSEDQMDVLYKESLYPSVETAKRIFVERGRDYTRFAEFFKIPVKDVMARLGPGLYVYVACRAATCHFALQTAVEKAYETNATIAPFMKNIPGKYDELLGVMKAENRPNNRALVKRILLTRQRSEEQQKTRNTKKATVGSGTAGGRRTRRRKYRRK